MSGRDCHLPCLCETLCLSWALAGVCPLLGRSVEMNEDRCATWRSPKCSLTFRAITYYDSPLLSLSTASSLFWVLRVPIVLSALWSSSFHSPPPAPEASSHHRSRCPSLTPVFKLPICTISVFLRRFFLFLPIASTCHLF